MATRICALLSTLIEKCEKQIWWHNSYKLECDQRQHGLYNCDWNKLHHQSHYVGEHFPLKNKMETWETTKGDSPEQRSARQWSWGTRGWKWMTMQPLVTHYNKWWHLSLYLTKAHHTSTALANRWHNIRKSTRKMFLLLTEIAVYAFTTLMQDQRVFE